MADPINAPLPWEPQIAHPKGSWYDRFADLAQRAYGPLAWSTFPTTDQARMRLNSATFGFGDEGLAALSTLAGGDYGANLRNERQHLKDLWDKDPGGAIRETVYGTIPWFGVPGSFAKSSAPWLGRLAGYTGMGAAQGAVSGLGEGQGGLGPRATHAAEGALTGAAMMGLPFLGYHAAKAFPTLTAALTGGALGTLVPTEAQGAPTPKGFFSALEEALRQSKSKAMPAEQWSKYLTPGRREVTMGDLRFPLRDEELKWSGLPGYLEGRNGERVTVDELLRHLENRPLPEFKDPGNSARSEAVRNIVGDTRLLEAADQYSNGLIDRFQALEAGLTPAMLTRLSRMHQIPNAGEQYKQHILPGPTTGYGEELTKFDSYQQKINADQLMELRGLERKIERTGRLTPVEQRRLDDLQRLEIEDNKAGRDSRFTSSHFGSEGQDLLSHSRWSRRQTDDGRPVHLVEEIQSDWHQQGREKGYQGQTEGERSSGEVPPAPFSKTYHELELKKNLARAVANGDEYLALTTGTQQADRWNQLLAKNLKEISWTKLSDGRVILNPMGAEGEVRGIGADRIMDSKRLREMVGKEMADKILKDPAERGILTGDNLSIGGAGMRHTYDEVYKGYLEKLAKQLGGEVTTVKVPNSKVKKYATPDEEFKAYTRFLQENGINTGNMGAIFDTIEGQERMRELNRKFEHWQMGTHEVPALRLTDKLKVNVRKSGLPLFSAPAATGAAGLTGYLGLRPPEDDVGG